MKLDHYFTLYTKINWDYIKDLNIRSKTLQFLGEKFADIGFDSEFMDMTPKA